MLFVHVQSRQESVNQSLLFLTVYLFFFNISDRVPFLVWIVNHFFFKCIYIYWSLLWPFIDHILFYNRIPRGLPTFWYCLLSTRQFLPKQATITFWEFRATCKWVLISYLNLKKYSVIQLYIYVKFSLGEQLPILF